MSGPKLLPITTWPWKLNESSITQPRIGQSCWAVLAKFGVVRPIHLWEAFSRWGSPKIIQPQIIGFLWNLVNMCVMGPAQLVKSIYHLIHGGGGGPAQPINWAGQSPGRAPKVLGASSNFFFQFDMLRAKFSLDTSKLRNCLKCCFKKETNKYIVWWTEQWWTSSASRVSIQNERYWTL